MDEKSILHKYSLVRSYLVKLGYQESLITTEVSVKEAQVDLVVYNDSHSYIAIEIKHTIPDRDPELLKFHPYVRKLQAHAAALGAPYYLLTDGISFLWFRTDPFGRPELLDAPLSSSETMEKHIQSSKDSVVRSLRSLRQHLYGRDIQENELAALIILAKVLSDHGDNQLRLHLLNREPILSNSPRLSLLNSLYYLYDNVEQIQLNIAFDILDSISFSSATPHDLLSSLDEVFFTRQFELRLARWLSDLLFRFGQIQPQDSNTVLDICCNSGNILVAAGMALKDVSLWGLCRNKQSALWAQLQQVIIGHHEGTIIVEEVPPYHILHSSLLPEPTHIITVPPFGAKIDVHKLNSQLFSSGVHQIEDIYLELAINCIRSNGRVVMLVPEGLLFSSGKRKITRRFLRDHVRITAIISLDSGALLPYSGIKTSILVLDKVPDLDNYQIFMAIIQKKSLKDTFNCSEIPQLADVLEDFESWTISEQIKPNSLAWVVPIKNLDIDDLTVKHYLPSERYLNKQFILPYQTLPLKDLTKLIKHGTNIDLDTPGNIRIVGPSAIRPMILNTNSLEQTTEEKLPPQSLMVQAGDILLNNRSTYLGAAIVANEEVEGSYISRQVILIRPDTSQILPTYLAAAINSEYVKPQLQQKATGSLMPTLSLERLADVSIPVPNLDTQQHIVDIVEKARNDLLQAQKQFQNAESRFLSILQSLSEEGYQE